jgi:hypothetical protein
MSEPLCATCGHPRDNHPYRHPFAGPSKDDTIKELEAKLAAAVEGLRGFMSKVDTACLVERDHPQAEFADAWRDAYAIIVEIEGTDAP